MTEKNNDKKNISEFSLEALSGLVLEDARDKINKRTTMIVPKEDLSNFGTHMGMILPYINSLEDSGANGETLYRIINSRPQDNLKAYKGGFAPYYQTGGIGSMAILSEAGSKSGKMATSLNPTAIMMAVALYSIEKQLEDISDTQREILSFLEVEKESEIEGNLETLMNILNKYKNNWDNQKYLSSNHKMVLDIQKESRTNIIGFKKKVNDIIESKQFLVASKNVDNTLRNLEKKFNYYKLSLYTFALSSFLEIMLSRNFNEDYILGIRNEIIKMSMDYRDLFGKSSIKLENMSNSAIDTAIIKGLGNAGNKVGSIAKSLPKPVFNKNKSAKENKNTRTKKIQRIDKADKPVKAFALLSNPGTGVITERMDEIIDIYNHSNSIYFDKDNFYLVLDSKK